MWSQKILFVLIFFLINAYTIYLTLGRLLGMLIPYLKIFCRCKGFFGYLFFFLLMSFFSPSFNYEKGNLQLENSRTLRIFEFIKKSLADFLGCALFISSSWPLKCICSMPMPKLVLNEDTALQEISFIFSSCIPIGFIPRLFYIEEEEWFCKFTTLFFEKIYSCIVLHSKMWRDIFCIDFVARGNKVKEIPIGCLIELIFPSFDADIRPRYPARIYTVTTCICLCTRHWLYYKSGKFPQRRN